MQSATSATARSTGRMYAPLVHTYSIVAYDPEAQQLGVAVQSHYFAVGKVVPWAEAGVGVVATQAWTEASYGPLGLALMRGGKSAGEALRALLACDSDPEMRQVAMIDASGGTAAHTGTKCIDAAGHRQGIHCCTQANLMLNNTVWDAMGQGFEAAQGDLAERMLAALYAAEAEGGDIRGKQSAALVVVSAQPTKTPWNDRIFDIRVDDSPEPLRELRRLLAMARAYRHGHAAIGLLVNPALDERKFELARHEFEQIAVVAPEVAKDFELIFHYGVALVVANRMEEALPFFRQAFALNPIWREVVPRLMRTGVVPGDGAMIDALLQQI